MRPSGPTDSIIARSRLATPSDVPGSVGEGRADGTGPKGQINSSTHVLWATHNRDRSGGVHIDVCGGLFPFSSSRRR
jgi:hypothetical protein